MTQKLLFSAPLRRAIRLRAPCTVAIVASMGLLLAVKPAMPAEPAADKPSRPAEPRNAGNPIEELKELLGQALKFKKEGNLPEAAKAADGAVAIAKKVFAKSGQETLAKLIEFDSDLHEANGDYAGAKSLLQDRLDITARLYGPDDWRTTDARLAARKVDQVAGLSPEQRNELAQADQWHSQAASLHGGGRYQEAATLEEKCAAVRRRLLGENHPDYAESLNSLAEWYGARGDYARAVPLFRQALEIDKKTLGEHHPHYAASLDNLAYWYQAQGDYARAEPLCRQALDIWKKTLGENNPDYATSLNNLAMLFESEGDYPRAEPLYRQASEIMKKVRGENHPDYATSLNNLAELYHAQGQHARAEPLYRMALQIRKETLGDHHPDYAQSLNNLAELYRDQGDYARAEPLYRQTSEIWKQTLGENHPRYATSLNNLALLYYSRGDYARAAPLLRQASEIWRKTLGENHPLYAKSLSNLALVCQAQGDYLRTEALLRQASEVYKNAVGENHPDYATSLNNLAELYSSQGDYARAGPLLRQASAILKKALGENHLDYATNLYNLALSSYLQGDYAAAEPLARQAVGIARRQMELTSAIQSPRQQLAMLDSLRRYIDGYLSLAADNHNGAEAVFAEILAWKGIVLQRQRQIRAVGDKPELLPLFRELQQVTARMAHAARATPDARQAASWQQQVQELTEEKERLEAELSARSAEYRQARHRATLAELQAALPPRTVLIDFLAISKCIPADVKAKSGPRFEQHLLAAVVRKDTGVELLDLGPIAPITEAIETWRPTFGTSPEGAAAARFLREKLWLPLESKIADAKLVLISPDGALGRFPFAALPGKAPGTYLLEERTIGIVPYSAMLPEIAGEQGGKQPQNSFQNLLLMGNIDYDAQPGDSPPPNALVAQRDELPQKTRAALAHFGPLEGTAKEVASIQETFLLHSQRARLTPLIGASATKQAFLREAPRHRYVHVATHGYFVPEDLRAALPLAARDDRMQSLAARRETQTLPGFASGLAFAGANHPPAAGADPLAEKPLDDGILTSEEIGTTNLDEVQLVVLSACETGLGKAAGGEGLLGLQRSFQAAGARTVVASLWKVDDEATRDLMGEFYRNHWDRRMPPLEALRAAQLRMLREGGSRGIERGPDFARAVPLPTGGNTSKKLSPRYWAAFVLSGDWR